MKKGIYHQRVGKFLIRMSTEDWPFPGQLEHTEPNGNLEELQLFGIEELYDLRYAADALIRKMESA